MSDGQLPHDERLEAALVARLLVDPAQAPVIGGSLAAEDFYVPVWRRAYAGIQKLSREQRVVDVVALQAEIGDEADELGRNIGEITSAWRAPLDQYADLIRTFAFRRRLIGALESLSTKAMIVGDREQLLSDLHDAVVRVSSGYEDGSLLSPLKAADKYRASLESRAKGERRGLSWPLKSLEDLLLPAAGGEMILIAARPSIGKTALAEQVADHWAHQAPYPILFASLEMSIEQLVDRTMSRETEIYASDVVRGLLNAKEQALLDAALEGRKTVGLWYLDDPRATTASLRAAAAKVRVIAGGLSGVVIDYIQLLTDSGDQEVQRVTKISRQIKALAREFDVPVLALSQLNRSVTAREDQRPRLHDLRESGALEQDADRVIALSREIGKPLTNIEVLKARQGPVGLGELWFDRDHISFRDPDHREQSDAAAAQDASTAALEAM